MKRRIPSQVAQFVSLLVVLTAAACSQDPIGPTEPPETPEEKFETLAELVVSEAIGAASSVGRGRAYVSLPPGTLPFGANVEIQNLTARSELQPVPVIEGGFDPVAVRASSGDELQLMIRNGATRVARAIVPERRAPVIVRTSVDPWPRVVFSEPIDPETLPGRVRISRGATLVSDRFAIVGDEPWAVELDSEVELESATTHELRVDDAILDLAGERLEAPLTVTFTTPTRFEIDGGGRIAFVSDRDGDVHIYVMEPDGTGLTRVAVGWSPTWSPDGTRLAFYRDGIHVIDADGSDERQLVANGYAPAWSPDGRRIAFERGVDLYVVDADGSGEALLVSGEAVSHVGGINAQLQSPTWSPDGEQVAFATTEGSIFIAKVDGSAIRRFTLEVEEFRHSFLSEPAWSPGGSRLGFTIDNGRIASAALDGGDIHVHTRPGYGSEWSANGAYLVYHYSLDARSCDWSCPTRIRVLDLASGQFRRLVPDVSATNPSYGDASPVWSR